jgi:hypothetical protein
MPWTESDLTSKALDGWRFTRGETLAILQSLDDEQLQFRPNGEGWKPLFWQFGCIGRTQRIYAEAVLSGVMDFGLFALPRFPAQDTYTTKAAITHFLDDSDRRWCEAIRRRTHDTRFAVDWSGREVPLPQHIAALQEHERLHHGQFIAYFALAGYALPESFRENWGL